MTIEAKSHQQQRPRRSLMKRLGISFMDGSRVQRSDLVMALILFLPGFIILVLLGTYPIFSILSMAFQKRTLFDVSGTWAGLENFVTVLSSKLFWIALKNDVIYTLTTVPIQTILGLGVALLLNQNFPFRNIFRSFLLFSYIVPTTVAAIIWRFMLSDSVGILYYGVKTLHLPIQNTWFSTPDTAMPTVILITVWKFFPFMVINFLAGLQTIDTQLIEAARVDGANHWQAFRHVTLPMLMPVIIMVMLLRTIWTFNSWDVIALLTNGGPIDSTTTLPLLIYNTTFGEFNMGRAAALAFVTMLILVASMIIYMRFYRRTEENLQ
ncbi:MAG: sugar ABC transporter permease [Anaerolineae bacterium]